MNHTLRPLNWKAGNGGRILNNPPSGETERSQLLLEFNNAVVSQVDLDDLLKSIFERVKKVFTQTTAATLAINNAETNELRIHLLHSDDPRYHRLQPRGVSVSAYQPVHKLRLHRFRLPAPGTDLGLFHSSFFPRAGNRKRRKLKSPIGV